MLQAVLLRPDATAGLTTLPRLGDAASDNRHRAVPNHMNSATNITINTENHQLTISAVSDNSVANITTQITPSLGLFLQESNNIRGLEFFYASGVGVE